jgi:hypothetical protein
MGSGAAIGGVSEGTGRAHQNIAPIGPFTVPLLRLVFERGLIDCYFELLVALQEKADVDGDRFLSLGWRAPVATTQDFLPRPKPSTPLNSDNQIGWGNGSLRVRISSYYFRSEK